MSGVAKARLALVFSMAGMLAMTAGAQSIQVGIRLSPESSIQWNGSNSLFLGDGRVIEVSTTHGAIREVWPGPTAGSFAVHTSEGLGVLAGDDIVILANPGANAIVRSSRTDSIWIAVPDSSGERREIAQWRDAAAARVLVRSENPITDFDVSEAGRIAYLAGGKVIVTEGGARQSVAAPAGTRRVFLSRDGSVLTVLTSSSLCRGSSTAPAATSCTAFDPATRAVVRDAWSGEIRLEAIHRPAR